MKKNKLRVIQISGIRGLLSAIFVVACLIAGFVGFPALMLNKLWNYLADVSGFMPYINAFQGLVLWGILALSYIIINKKQKFLVAFEPKQPSRREIKDIIDEIKAQSAELKEVPKKTLETQELKIQPQTNTKDKEEEKSKEVV